MIHLLDYAIDHRSDLHKNGRSATLILYVLATADREYFRIGVTSRPISHRLREHSGYGPKAIELNFLVAVPAAPSDESCTHHAFSAHRVPDKSEWFNYSEEIEEWVRWLKHRVYALNTIEQANNLELRAKAREHAATESWLPSSQNVMSATTLDIWGDLIGEPVITGDDYYTPKHIIEAARKAMGGIDTDPATHYLANKTFIHARHVYTIQSDGLKRPWYGHVWCNPPFNQWSEWVPKILAEAALERVTDVCVLLPCRAMSRLAVADLLSAADCLWISKGRLQFWGEKATGSPDDGSIIIYLGGRTDEFVDAFSPYGPVKVSATNRDRTISTGEK